MFTVVSMNGKVKKLVKEENVTLVTEDSNPCTSST